MKIQDVNARQYVNQLNFLEIDYFTFRKLRKMEKRCSRIAENLCNYENYFIPDNWSDKQVAKVVKLCPKLKDMNVFINMDPRGYALKVDNAPDGMYKDWGGFGIVAPEF